ncbi:MAG TPA: type IV pilus assembly protein PilM [Gemmataceae bacterium]
MPVLQGVWGIDVGQSALKALRLEVIDGVLTATAFDYVEHPKILSQPDADPDQLIREALDKFLSRNEIKHDEVAIGIAGQSGLARFVKLPPVEQKKIAEIVKFEAKQQIPFPLDEVVWDYQKIAGGDVTDGFAMETEIGLFAMKRDVISRYLGYFGGSKIEVHCVQMSPLALVNFTTYETLKKGGSTPLPEEPPDPNDDTPRGKKRCVVVLDIGTEASNLIITDGAKIIWQRPLPLGGNNFTRALTKELKLTFAKAEHLKRNAAKSPELPQILKALKPVLQDFVGEVQRSLGYFTNTHRDAHVGYLVGLGSAFRLPGLQKYLAEKLQIDVRKPATFDRLTGDAVLKDPLFLENLLTFPVAYGLALQGLNEARLTTNLLPAEIRTDRMIRQKKPFAVAAAAVLLLGTAGLALGYGANYSSLNDAQIASAITKAKSAVSAVGTQESKYTAKQTEMTNTQNVVKAVISGNDERLNWPRFEEVFSMSLPRPGAGGNLAAELWQKDQGRDAVAWFHDRMRKGVRIEDAAIDERSAMPQALAMVNVEAVHTRWVDNLVVFYQNADKEVFGDVTSKVGFNESISRFMKDDEKEPDDKGGPNKPTKPKVPAGGGWIVEIRGYTDNKEEEQFIKKALLANLQRMDAFADKGKDKVGKYMPEVVDPIKGRVSHAFIYHVWPVPNAQPNIFQHIDQSYLDPLAGGTGAATDNKNGPAMGGSGSGSAKPLSGSMSPGTPSSSAAAAEPGGPVAGQPWLPLTSQATSALGAGSMSPGMPASGPSSKSPGSSTAGMPKSNTGAMTSIPGLQFIEPPKLATGSGPARNRYEFVVMFLWREPGTEVRTPGDLLNGPPAAAAQSGSGSGSLMPASR